MVNLAMYKVPKNAASARQKVVRALVQECMDQNLLCVLQVHTVHQVLQRHINARLDRFSPCKVPATAQLVHSVEYPTRVVLIVSVLEHLPTKAVLVEDRFPLPLLQLQVPICVLLARTVSQDGVQIVKPVE